MTDDKSLFERYVLEKFGNRLPFASDCKVFETDPNDKNVVIVGTVRDLSRGYNFENDKARNVLAIVTRDEILSDNYYEALAAEGVLDYYFGRNEREL